MSRRLIRITGYEYPKAEKRQYPCMFFHVFKIYFN
jgi:hypothetical protein